MPYMSYQETNTNRQSPTVLYTLTYGIFCNFNLNKNGAGAYVLKLINQSKVK